MTSTTPAQSSPLADSLDLEDKTVAANANIEDGAGKTLFPRRPAYATASDAVDDKLNLVANCVDTQNLSRLPGSLCFYHYNMRVTRIMPPKSDKPECDRPECDKPESDKPESDKPESDNPASNEPVFEAVGTKLGHILYHVFNTKDNLRQLVKDGKLASDFRNTIFTTKKLDENECSFVTEYKGEKSRYHSDTFKVTFAETEPEDLFGCPLSSLTSYLVSTDQTQAEEARNGKIGKVIQALNIFLRHEAKNDSLHPFMTCLPNYLPPTRAVVGNKTYHLTKAGLFNCLSEDAAAARAIRGCFSSLRPAAGKLLLNINLTFGPFHNRQGLPKLLGTLGSAGWPVEKRHEFIKGIRVRVNHREPQKKEIPANTLRVIKTISGLSIEGEGDAAIAQDWDQCVFTKDNRVVTVRDHFKAKYPKQYQRIERMRLERGSDRELVVNVGTTKRPDFVPITACTVVDGQTYGHELNRDESREMIFTACKKPNQVRRDINKIAPVTGLTTRTFDGGMALGTNFDLIQLKGKRLHYKSVRFSKELPTSGDRANWSMADNRFKYSVPAAWPKWAILKVLKHDHQPRSDQELPSDNMTQKARARFANYSGPALNRKMDLQQNPAFGAAYQKILRQLTPDGIKLVLVWLPSGGVSADHYKTMKRISDSVVGIHTVLVDSNKAGRTWNKSQNLQYWDNVLLKVNLKLGGVNQTVTMPPGLIEFGTTMVVGMDVTHFDPDAGEEAKSIIGMVASVDERLGQWPGTICEQSRPGMATEIDVNSRAINDVLTPHLERWKTKHGKYPAQILVYRDGVSEGQYRQVVEHEYKHMKALCQSLYGEPVPGQAEPRITIVVVGKRHHMRFYQVTQEGSRTSTANPPPGTLVDRSVTSQFLWEFYLQAQCPIQGTARPAHYIVVVDQIFGAIPKDAFKKNSKYRNASDVLYGVTHALSYALGRSTTATSVCAPAFWADKLCDRARFFNEPKVHKNLEGTMYYV